jgi:hypothetical protein|tara:strand:- start:3036 stop:3317 length:282 start_codon:yes stop_codon:yes gene_type:complete
MSNQYAVDKGIAVKKESGRKYPWAMMGVGDSFFVPAGDSAADRYLRSSIYNSGRSSLLTRGLDRSDGYNVVVRKTEENGTVGLRAWLVGPPKG